MTTTCIMKKVKAASPAIKTADTETKNRALIFMADMLLENADDILNANAVDVEAARGKISEL